MGSYFWAEVNRYGQKKRGVAFKIDDGFYEFWEDGKGYSYNVSAMYINELPLDIRVSDIKVLIDLALMTNDKEWFNELVTKYNELKQTNYI